VVTWSALILGHVKYGRGQKALELFQQMQREGVQPDAIIFVGVLNACASIMALEEGRRGHEHIIQSGCESDAFVGSSLIDMYAKCGSMEEASRVDEGLHFYALMTTVYRIPAKLEHCTCMVDLLGHAGHLQEADNIIQGMPCKPDAAVWIALLAACRIHGNLEMGERVAKRVLELKPENAAGYVLLPNLYAATGNLELSENVERQRKERDVKKQPGCTWIEVNDVVHTFVVDDQTHP